MKRLAGSRWSFTRQDYDLTEAGLVEQATTMFGENAPRVIAAYRAVDPHSTPFKLISRIATDGSIREVAVPDAQQPDETPPPCPEVEVTDPEIERMLGPAQVLLRCDDGDTTEVVWPRYECYWVDRQMVATYAPGDAGNGSYFVCSPAPWPTVARVLVVAGRPILLTDQTLEVLDPAAFTSAGVLHHPTGARYGH